MTVKALIEEICEFLKGNDHSLTPQLRRMHGEYSSYVAELCSQVEGFRRIAEEVSLADAASQARQLDPPLARRAEMLDFPGRQEFLEICKMYDLPPVQTIDTEFVARLTEPLDDTSVKIATLMQEWRRIARTGSTAQRLELLRRIVAARPDDGAWARNLVELEKKRYGEIQDALSSATSEHPLDFQTLDGFHRELHSPLLLSKPPVEVVRCVLEKFLPLQEARVAQRLEECLKALEISFGEHDNKAVEAELRRWNQLASSPLAHPDSGQRQYVEDVRSALDREEQEAQRQAKFDMLLEQFRGAMADAKTPYSEALALYNQLALLGLPLPQALQEDMDRLTEEHDATERRLHARRIVFGFMGVVIVVVALLVSITIIQRRNRVQKCCEALRACLDAQDYSGALQFLEDLSQKDARTVSSAEVQALYAEAQAGQAAVEERRALAKAEFQKLKSVLSEKVMEDFLGTDEMEKLLGRLEELNGDLDEEDKKESLALVASERAAYRQLVLAHEKAFRENWSALVQEMDDLRMNLQAIPEISQIDGALLAVSQKMDAMRAETSIDAGLRNVTEEQYKEKLEILTYVVEAERLVRSTLGQLRHPVDFEAYLQALKTVAETKDEVRYDSYRPICGMVDDWCEASADLSAIGEYFAQGKAVEELSSPIGQNFMSFLPKDESDMVADFVQDVVQKHFDYYELMAKDALGREYFFYAKEIPVSERDRRNRKDYRYVGFDTDVYANKGQDAFAFVLEDDGAGKVFYRDVEFTANRSARKLPEIFVKLDGWLYPEKSDVYRLASEALGQEKSGASQFQVVKEMLQKSGMIRNPILRYWWTMEALGMMKKLSPMASEMVGHAERELKQWPLQISRWKNPLSCVAERTLLPSVRDSLSKLDVSRIAQSSDLLWQFLGAFYSRSLVPVGVIAEKTDSVLTCSFFQESTPVEACVLAGDELHLVDEGILLGTKAIPQNSALLFEGQLLWAFADGMKTEDFLQRWREKCRTADVKLELTPAICPKELRYLLR